MIRVLIAEDQAMLLSALGTLLDLEDDLEVVALAKNGKEALELARTTAPDIVLTDIEMPELGGLELAERIRDEQLASGARCCGSRRSRNIRWHRHERPRSL